MLAFRRHLLHGITSSSCQEKIKFQRTNKGNFKMKTSTLWNGAMLIAVCGWFIPSAWGANPAQLATAEIQDIVLRPDQSLHGIVVDSAGETHANVPVTVFQHGNEVARTETDADGRFVACGLRGGSCIVQYPDQVRQYRVWTPKAAPPSACGRIFHRKKSCQRTNKCNCQHHGRKCKKCRGCKGTGMIGGVMKSPLALAAIGAAVAVPIALNDDDDNNAS